MVHRKKMMKVKIKAKMLDYFINSLAVHLCAEYLV